MKLVRTEKMQPALKFSPQCVEDAESPVDVSRDGQIFRPLLPHEQSSPDVEWVVSVVSQEVGVGKAKLVHDQGEQA